MTALSELAARSHAATERHLSETEFFVEHQKIRRALAPAHWEEFVKDLGKSSKAVNDTPTSQVRIVSERIGLHEFRLTNAGNGRQARFVYEPDMPRISYQGFDDGGYFAFTVNENGTAVQLFDPKRSITVLVNGLALDVMMYLTRSS